VHQVHTSRVNAATVLTAARVVLAAAVGVAALAGGPRWLLGVLVTVALLTDLADGRLARATGTASEFGARLDQEADALLILVLSAIVAADVGWWVLGIGLARYGFGALFTLIGPLRTAPAEPRFWCKTVAVLVGVVLAAAVALPLPDLVVTVAVAVVAVLLAESFVHEAVDRWRAPGAPLEVPYGTVLAFLVVWLALVAPTDRDHLTGTALLRLPLEVLVVVGLALVPWRRLRVSLTVASGLLLALLLLVKVLDLSFNMVFDRDFAPVGDWAYLGPGVGVLGDSIGAGWARVVAVLAGLATLALLVGVPLAMLRLVKVAASRRRWSLTAATAFVTVWLLCFATGVQAMKGAPVASTSAASLTVDEVQLVRADLADMREFSDEIDADPYAERAAADPEALLSGLAGKDVLLVFVESYGRVAVQDTSYSEGITQLLDQSTEELAAAGYHAQSAFLTSPTFGAGSWLAHATMQSGLWVDSQRRYRQLIGADRLTLTSLFGQAGWRTVFDVPANTEDWPEGREFYDFEAYYDSRNVGYDGPKFGYAPMPDQFTLEDFRRRELAPADRLPVMAEIDLISSHHPWTPLPDMVPWDQVGDGSIYDGMPEQGKSSQEVFEDPEAVKRAFGESVEYSWEALTSFLTTYNDPNLVLVVLGDHQPHKYVSGEDPGHDVPISVIAQDPAVMERIAGWGWQDGLRPSPDATVWRMDAFRDRFLQAFGTTAG
jgi:phosphatidylglycerophosphate synthase